ncbi:hypothetical protein LPTSP4_01430 [Leptospira ryugenii]|uniref:DUF3703 domain-containing protein n=1 Tax=Leptospira ryugenii TaxID=1917863 RepID=A0A2P2DVI8_9LEPT|nr:DUF3703 domain-containing protein [Leptospira ryugenii]GBF48643.1 hypothetical protein LPTSP4_01430 [Leptospira ryugenii]
MNKLLKSAFDAEMQIAKNLFNTADFKMCFHHLERAHILGQRNAIPHTVNHWWMLKVGLKLHDSHEVRGQLLRILVAGIGSIFGRVPIGNTGGANIGIMQTMPIPPDLQEIFIRLNR